MRLFTFAVALISSAGVAAAQSIPSGPMTSGGLPGGMMHGIPSPLGTGMPSPAQRSPALMQPPVGGMPGAAMRMPGGPQPMAAGRGIGPSTDFVAAPRSGSVSPMGQVKGFSSSNPIIGR